MADKEPGKTAVEASTIMGGRLRAPIRASRTPHKNGALALGFDSTADPDEDSESEAAIGKLAAAKASGLWWDGLDAYRNKGFTELKSTPEWAAHPDNQAEIKKAYWIVHGLEYLSAQPNPEADIFRGRPAGTNANHSSSSEQSSSLDVHIRPRKPKVGGGRYHNVKDMKGKLDNDGGDKYTRYTGARSSWTSREMGKFIKKNRTCTAAQLAAEKRRLYEKYDSDRNNFDDYDNLPALAEADEDEAEADEDEEIDHEVDETT